MTQTDQQQAQYQELAWLECPKCNGGEWETGYDEGQVCQRCQGTGLRFPSLSVACNVRKGQFVGSLTDPFSGEVHHSVPKEREHPDNCSRCQGRNRILAPCDRLEKVLEVMEVYTCLITLNASGYYRVQFTPIGAAESTQAEADSIMAAATAALHQAVFGEKG